MKDNHDLICGQRPRGASVAVPKTEKLETPQLETPTPQLLKNDLVEKSGTNEQLSPETEEHKE